MARLSRTSSESCSSRDGNPILAAPPESRERGCPLESAPGCDYLWRHTPTSREDAPTGSIRPTACSPGARPPGGGHGQGTARPGHLAHFRRGVRNADGCRIALQAMLDRRLLQERPVGSAGLVSQDATERTHFVDMEGRDEDDARTVADCRFVRFRRIAADIVRSQVDATSQRRYSGWSANRPLGNG